MKNIAIFASGSGTNAQNIAEYFRESDKARVSLILSNRNDAFVLERAKRLGIPAFVFNREEFYNHLTVLRLLDQKKTDLVVLAGFLWLIPPNLLTAYPNRIVNIHPALLPRHGGKGMYGDKVHQAVIASGDKKTGISIHYVNAHYDEGQVIFQEAFDVLEDDTPESIAQKVHQLEYLHFPRVIEEVLSKM